MANTPKYPAGQKDKFHNDQPIASLGQKSEMLKKATNVEGTKFLRKLQYGKPDSMKP